MKILLTGSQGQVGKAVIEAAASSAVQLLPFDHQTLDITDISAVRQMVAQIQPAGMINAAAYTAVDKAEAERDKAFAVNADGAANLAQAAAQYDIPLIHLSTDYIFNGEKTAPYIEQDTACPLNVYGESKWAGEQAIRRYSEKYIILRVSWVFGEYGHNFVKSMLNLMKSRESLQIVADQTGCPTYAGDIAEVLLKLIRTANHNWGTYHYTGTPPVTWYDFAQSIYTAALAMGYPLKTKIIQPIETPAYPTPARRPKNSVLDSSLFEQTFKLSLQPWQKGLNKLLKRLYVK